MIITLLSDLCVSDGGVYNSSLDQDVCHDQFGFPYIPAKRIRGCLRECALELQDWGADISPDKMFGSKGNSVAPIRISDALLKNYKDYAKNAHEFAGNPIFNEQNILQHFSYIRSQTAVDYKTGAAEDASLRTMRVVNKGLVFSSEVEVQSPELLEDLTECCAVFTHMGVSRTRGLGEVHVELRKVDTEEKKKVSVSPNAQQITYTIELLEPVICKSVNGAESNSLDYIDGGKVLGIIANSLSNDDFINFINEAPLSISNAYLSKEQNRYTEIPACFCTVKNASWQYRNKLFEIPENNRVEQLSMARGTYALRNIENPWKILDVAAVEIEQRYHHRRADDKSIGRADPVGNDADFYQMSSICAGQSFTGTITGSPKQIQVAVNALTKKPIQYIGYSRSSEYGKVKINIRESKPRKTILSEIKSFAVVLESPTIIYNDRAFYSTDPDDLIDEILMALGLPASDIENSQKFIKYVTIGGFNVTWQARKPIITTFDKGTTIAFILKSPVNIQLNSTVTLGELKLEGFGEFSVYPFDAKDVDNYAQSVKSSLDKEELPRASYRNIFVKDLCKDLLRRYLDEKSMENVKENENEIVKPKNRSTISNLTLMCEETSATQNSSNYFETIRAKAESRLNKGSDLKKDKYKTAERILRTKNNKSGIAEIGYKQAIKDFADEYHVDYFQEEDWMAREYLIDFLTNAKYQIREGK